MRKILLALAIVAVGGSSAAAQNALKNPGFEDPTFTSGTSLGRWFRFDSGTFGSSAESTMMPRSGARHIALETSGANQFAGLFQTLENPAVPGANRPIAPGEIVTFSGWHKAVGTSNQTSEIKIEWIGAPQNRLDVLNVPVGAYTQFSHQGVAPAGTTGATITYVISTFGAGQTGNTLVYIDDFQVTLAGFPGDFNFDGRVNAADYTVWRDGGSPDDTIAGYNLWKANFGKTSGSGAASNAIPEPASIALMLLAALVFFAVRFGRR
jgi:hypothetical protein